VEFPFRASRRWHQFFIKIKKPHLCFHCLRVTCINRLRVPLIPSSQPLLPGFDAGLVDPVELEVFVPQLVGQLIYFQVHSQGSLPGLTPRCAFIRSSGHGWLGMLVALVGAKSAPIGTVFRSKERKCTNLVRFSGFLVLLSRFVVVVQEIIPAPGWIREGGWGGFKAAAMN
jgi:hypothetical protein